MSLVSQVFSLKPNCSLRHALALMLRKRLVSLELQRSILKSLLYEKVSENVPSDPYTFVKLRVAASQVARINAGSLHFRKPLIEFADCIVDICTEHHIISHAH